MCLHQDSLFPDVDNFVKISTSPCLLYFITLHFPVSSHKEKRKHFQFWLRDNSGLAQFWLNFGSYLDSNCAQKAEIIHHFLMSSLYNSSHLFIC